jgi:cytochrome c oxidase accessory protein FixG
VKGRWTTLRRIGFALLIAIYAVLPWIEINGNPAVFLDIQHRKFFLFGLTFNAQDVWLAFFLLTGIGFGLIVLTALLGRVWCGYACPQTVFLEGVYRRVERIIEGPRSARIKRNAGPMTFDKLWRKSVKHGIFVVLSLLVAHIFISYFVSLPKLFEMVRSNPTDHPEAFAWMVGITGIMYGNFAFFREQLCLIVCPYGRLQSVLMDKESILVGYDEKRGEPRGKKSDPNTGDCVDCNRCVVVCPTGIDIRHGAQLDCIGCANCIDACDEIMDKLGRDRGLIRYDSLSGLEGGKRRFLRPRLALYAVLGVIGVAVASLAIQSREPFEANMLRLRGAPFVVEDETVRNSFEIHLVNKENETRTFRLQPVPSENLSYVVAIESPQVPSLDSTHVPVFVTHRRGDLRPGQQAQVQVSQVDGDHHPITVQAPLLGPDR